MEKLTREEYIRRFNQIMSLLDDRTDYLDDKLDWSGEDLEIAVQERIQDLAKIHKKLMILSTTPIKEEIW